jgi:hypothetical protein
MFRVVSPTIIRNTYNCIYSIRNLSNRNCYRGGVGTASRSNSSKIAAGSSNGLTVPDAVDTVVCAPDDGWRYHPKHVEQFPEINKLCNVASCWIYIRIRPSCWIYIRIRPSCWIYIRIRQTNQPLYSNMLLNNGVIYELDPQSKNISNDIRQN